MPKRSILKPARGSRPSRAGAAPKENAPEDASYYSERTDFLKTKAGPASTPMLDALLSKGDPILAKGITKGLLRKQAK